mmetsp:Transcript_5565/g.12138  ORF Transcript_5565/g.12138 Transcript_5565/m.12138 type:complete len:153 (+) Transcript_5565:275-733(+)
MIMMATALRKTAAREKELRQMFKTVKTSMDMADRSLEESEKSKKKLESMLCTERKNKATKQRLDKIQAEIYEIDLNDDILLKTTVKEGKNILNTIRCMLHEEIVKSEKLKEEKQLRKYSRGLLLCVAFLVVIATHLLMRNLARRTAALIDFS